MVSVTTLGYNLNDVNRKQECVHVNFVRRHSSEYARHGRIRSVTVSRNRTIQIDIYLLPYNVKLKQS